MGSNMKKMHTNQKGMTIVELMISTAVFASILLIILTAITQIGRMYYKGVTNAKTQEVTRSIVDRISQEIQYSPVGQSTLYQTSGANNLRCVGKSRFFYTINQQNLPGTYGLWTDESATGSSACSDATAFSSLGDPTTLGGANARDLLAENMRILKFDIVNNDALGLYTVTVRVAYGDTDLLDQVTDGVSNSFCRGSVAGTQFCSVSELSSTVKKRL